MIRRILTNRLILSGIFCLVIFSGAFINAQAVPPQMELAEGRLSEVWASEMAFYPGDGMPFYPGDEKWDGRFQQAPVFPLAAYPITIASGGSGNVYVGGYFTQIGGQLANHIARWDGNLWHALGNGVGDNNGGVSAIAFNGTDVYVGGVFVQVDGQPAGNVARWDGSQWHPLGSGLRGTVNAIAVNGSDVYVGGDLYWAGGRTSYYFARWDGTQWYLYDLDSGVNGRVNAIAVSGSDVYVGGEFNEAGGQPASYIARWDGSQWYPLGSGVEEGTVRAIAVNGSDVYVGGMFDLAGGQTAYGIARWDGSQWHTVGSNGPRWISGLVIDGHDLYVVGGFHTPIGTYFANGIARWDGSQWHNLGSGITMLGSKGPLYPGIAKGVAVQGDQVLVIGDRYRPFEYAGNKLSPKFAIWHTRPEITLNYPDGGPGSTFMITGRYFPAGSPVTVKVNGRDVAESSVLLDGTAGTLTSDAYGEIRLNLVTHAQNSPGTYQVTLSAGGEMVGASYQLINGGTVWPPQPGVTALFTLPPVVFVNSYLPTIHY